LPRRRSEQTWSEPADQFRESRVSDARKVPFYTRPTLGRTLTSAAVTAAIVGAFWAGLALTHRGTGTAAGADPILTEVRQDLLQSYYRAVPANVLNAPSISAMLAQLDDPYTDYLDPTQFRLLRRETSSTYSGIGASVLPASEGLAVTQTQAGGPAALAGIRPRDLIVAINGHPTAGMSLELAAARIVGPVGETVRLTIRHDRWERELSIARRTIQAPSVQSRLLQDGTLRIGYLRLSAFRLGATPVLSRALARLARANAAGIVLDLRGNPGGVFAQAVGVASLFLDHGVIVTLVGAHSGRHVYSARPGTTKLPVVVLVDHGSASSAEIVAAALQDDRRALIVGENTYGKALVQSIRPLENGAALRLTTARYLTPSGTDISLRGVRPDLHAVDDPRTRDDEALQAALHLFLR
jgi:carboxyl-terminal processing protease